MEGKTEEEIEDAVANYEEYLSVVWDIANRLEREGKEVPTAEEIKAMEGKMLDDDINKRRKPKKKGLS